MQRSAVVRHCGACVLPCALAVVLASCAARRLDLPTDPGTPLPDFAAIHEAAAASCAGVRTLTAELGLSGRAGDRPLRGRVIAGFDAPSSMRLEGVAPFGAPAFVLAARGGSAVLVLPRDDRVVRGAPAEILGALTGVTLAPADLQAILSGCVVPAPRATAGRLHGGGWASIDLEGGATVYLRRSGNAWKVRAAVRDGWRIEYPEWPGAFPQSVRLISEGPVNVDVTAAVSQVEANVDIEPAAFTVEVPDDAQPLTLEDLRAAGPLSDESAR